MANLGGYDGYGDGNDVGEWLQYATNVEVSVTSGAHLEEKSSPKKNLKRPRACDDDPESNNKKVKTAADDNKKWEEKSEEESDRCRLRDPQHGASGAAKSV